MYTNVEHVRSDLENLELWELFENVVFEKVLNHYYEILYPIAKVILKKAISPFICLSMSITTDYRESTLVLVLNPLYLMVC